MPSLHPVASHAGQLLLLCGALCACSADPATRNSAAGLGVAVLAKTPSSNFEQIYYLGVFDPQEQLPPTIYRVRVRGQGSALNQTRYASGWVPAALIDSLSTVARFESKDSNAGVKLESLDTNASALLTGRRLMMFGPEGYREAPKDHRLVIAMGASPENFFSAIDEALGTVAMATQGQSGVTLQQGLFREVLRLRSERERLEDIKAELKANAKVMP